MRRRAVRSAAYAVTWTLTTLRVGLIPVFLWLAGGVEAQVGTPGEGRIRSLAIACLLAIGISDVLDGFIARRFGVETRAGAVADAVADKLAQVAVLGYFTFFASAAFWRIPGWFLALIVGRDATLLVGGAVVKRKTGDVPVEHAVHGRVASSLVFLLLLGTTAGLGPPWLTPVLWAAASAVVLSTASYVARGRRRMQGQAQQGTQPAGSSR